MILPKYKIGDSVFIYTKADDINSDGLTECFVYKTRVTESEETIEIEYKFEAKGKWYNEIECFSSLEDFIKTLKINRGFVTGVPTNKTLRDIMKTGTQ